MQKLSTLVVGLCLLGSSSLFAHSKVVTHQGDHMHQGQMSKHSNPIGMTSAQMAKFKQAKKDGLSKKELNKMIKSFKSQS